MRKNRYDIWLEGKFPIIHRFHTNGDAHDYFEAFVILDSHGKPLRTPAGMIRVKVATNNGYSHQEWWDENVCESGLARFEYLLQENPLLCQ